MTTVNLPDLYRRDSEVRRIAREIIKIKRDVRSLSRASQAAYRSSDGDENTPGDYDDDGNPLDPDGNTPGWVPPTPTPPDINPYREAVEFIWDGTFEDAEWSASIDSVLIHVLPDVGSTPEEATIVGTFGEGGGVFPYNVTLDEPLQYVSLQAVSIHGVVGDWSMPLPIIPLLGVDPADLGQLQDDLDNLNDVVLPSLQDDLSDLEGLFPIQTTSIADGAITTPKIIVGTLLGDRITVNSLSGDRIIVNTLYGDRIIVNSLSGDRIIANTIQGDRIIANTLQGDRIIAGTLVASQILSSSFIGYTFTGAIFQTDSSGNRMVMKEDSSGGVIEFWRGISGETAGKLNPTTLSGGRPGITINSGISPTYNNDAEIRFYAGGLGLISQITLDADSVYTAGNVMVGSNLYVDSIRTYTGANVEIYDDVRLNGYTLGEVSAVNNAGSVIDMDARIRPNQINVTAPRNDLTAIPNVRYASGTSGGELGYTSHANSSRRYKKNIHPLTDVLTREQVLAPKPKRHQMRKPPGDRPAEHEFWSLIAEDMHDAGLGNFLEYNDKNQPDEVDWAKFAAVGHQLVLVDHDGLITDHETKISGMMDEISALRAEIAELKNPA